MTIKRQNKNQLGKVGKVGLGENNRRLENNKNEKMKMGISSQNGRDGTGLATVRSLLLDLGPFSALGCLCSFNVLDYCGLLVF